MTEHTVGTREKLSAVPDLDWRLRWEADLTSADHDLLSALLLRVYPMHDTIFRDGRSWSGALPEVRVVGYDGARPVAHLGFVRRHLRIDDGADSFVVGDTGLVGVDPDYRGLGLGGQLLAECAAALRQQALPFGFLTCGPEVVPFYESGGWQLLPGLVTRMIDKDRQPEAYTGPALALPVTAQMEEWPAGRTVVRDGLEV
jgi:nodulation protein A